ncbi:Rab-like GTPase-activating protein [Vairimorpha necatrix]|uniref:Rab-like GTPase-activating protein n=1 Tax=Vairimorpha necatrix TaxID=6039 RepID=A0AAX4J8D4_9MICR
MDQKHDISKNYNITLVTDPSFPKEQVLCTNEYGFITDNFSNTIDINLHYIKKQWYEKIDKYKSDYKKYKKNPTILKLVRSGIPISLKYTVWKIFINRGFQHEYDLLKNVRTEYDHQIHVDVQRTFRKHYLFFKPYGRGQSELFNVLTASANFIPSIGYCQGMSSFAGIILMYFPEEEAFEMMVNIIKKNNLETLFDKSLSKIHKIQKLQSELMKLIIPDVLNHLIKNDIDINIYAISWYLTLFTRFEIRYVLRFWDLFLYFEFPIFLYIATSMLEFFGDVIMDLKDEQLVEFMSKIDTFEMDIDKIIFNSIKYAKKYDYQSFKKKLN